MNATTKMNVLRGFGVRVKEFFKKGRESGSVPCAQAPLTKKDKGFLAFSLVLLGALFVFQFWLGFPGY
ncbi:hypothetical protein ACRE1U_08635, partial [Helicobacter himalayensis]|uniref:hypothetical protein n=1 Tax=Helicobacter himalayensis TaxID=1591088 RepID=UPI003D6E30C6